MQCLKVILLLVDKTSIRSEVVESFIGHNADLELLEGIVLLIVEGEPLLFFKLGELDGWLM